jgi:broad specificity polyphosphatase/5'/3'-nucleotidase SurE
VPGPDAERRADVDAFRANRISITPLDVDMTSGGAGNALSQILSRLTP